MSVHHQTETVTLHHGDCLDVIRDLPDNSVDSIVTDPPYGLGFMGKAWDVGAVAFNPVLWKEALRVLKPGGHMVAFGGTRTWHRLAVAIEDAGFEIRDNLAWLYGSGFPKSLDVGKAVDKRGGASSGFEPFRDAVRDAMRANGVSRKTLQEALGNHMLSHYLTAASQPAIPNVRDYRIIRDMVCLGDRFDHVFIPEAEREVVGVHRGAMAGWDMNGGTRFVDRDITAPATDAAKQWNGWGTALKPAFEPIVLARKPFRGTVAGNVLEHGVGALNVDGCRVATSDRWSQVTDGMLGIMNDDGWQSRPTLKETHPAGRWPANVVLDPAAAAEVDEQSGVSKSTSSAKRNGKNPAEGWRLHRRTTDNARGHDDSGGASRFFPVFKYNAKAPTKERPDVNGVRHPTVKPLALMQWLVRLITPPGGTVLEPFAGSGATVEACIREGFACVAIERESEYLPLIVSRIERASDV